MSQSPLLLIDLMTATQVDKVPAGNDAVIAFEGSQEDQLDVDMSAGDVTLTDPLQYRRFKVFSCSGQTADRNLVVPLAKRVFMVRNKSSSHTVVVGGATGAKVTVGTSSMVSIQNDGTDCTLAVEGGTGAPGDAGGAISIAYTFSTTTTNADPGDGNLRLNNGTQGSATAIYLDLLSSDGTDYTAILDNLDAAASTEKGIARLYNSADPTKWLIASLTARVSHTGYRELTIAVIGISGSNPFGNGDALIFTFTRTGDAGTLTMNRWGAAQRSIETVLSFGSTVTPDFSASNNFALTLTGNCTIANPSNLPASTDVQAGQIVIIQDGTGGRTLSWGTDFEFTGGVAVAPASAADAVSIFSYFARGASGKIYLSPSPGFA